MKDQIIKFLAYDGRIAVACASTTNLVEEARNLHDLSPVATAALGIDVARYQGQINWDQVAASGVQFAMIRVG